jgi:hypothetical protein
MLSTCSIVATSTSIVPRPLVEAIRVDGHARVPGLPSGVEEAASLDEEVTSNGSAALELEPLAKKGEQPVSKAQPTTGSLP